jgi:hypothetical protein
MRRILLLLSLALVGCDDDKPAATPDAAVADAPPTPDAMTVNLTCTNYCTTIASVCTGANAQYGGSSAVDATAHCMGTCATFNTSANMMGATLGCHLYHTMNAMATGDLTTHCPHAGPAGDKVDATAGVCGDPCTNFCTLVQGVCTGANAAYASTQACMTACAGGAGVTGYDKTVPYAINTTTFPSTAPTGNNLACRLYHATNAAVSAAQAAIHCKHTAVTNPDGVCM